MGNFCCVGRSLGTTGEPQAVKVNVTSFNVLGLGFCALPGPEHQWSHFDTLFDELLTRRSPTNSQVSIIGLQEDVFVLKPGARWEDHTTRNTHQNFERISFMTSKMESHGFSLASFSVHDGLSTSSHMIIKDSDNQLAALTDARHQDLFTEVNANGKRITSSQQIKLGNSIWVKKGANLDMLRWRGDSDTFDTWEEAAKLGRIEYNMVPSRSAAKVIFQKSDFFGTRDVFVAATCHLAGGKFDDRWLLTGDALTGINGEMLNAFVKNCGTLPAVLFGDTNMKHHDFVDLGMYDGVISNMLFGTKDLSQITKLSAAYEGHRKYLLRIGDGEKVTENEVKSLQEAGKSLEDLAKVYDIEMSGQPGKINEEAVKILIRRAKELWRMNEVTDMQLLLPPTKESSSCLFGGVIDHILYKGMQTVEGSYCIDEKNVKAMIPQSPEVKNIFDRIKASDHFPVMADFVVVA